MSDNGRVELLERYGRAYGEHRLAVAFTQSLEGERAKALGKDWDKTAPLSDPDFAAALVKGRGERRNVAIVLRPSRLVGIEADGPDELAEVEGLGLPATVTVVSSTNTRRHFYFRPPSGLTTLPYVAFRFESGKVTADSGRYFVAPPSIHPSGAMYRFLPGHGVDELDFAELPRDTYERLAGRAKRNNREQRQTLAVVPDAKVQAGQRRQSVFRFASMQRRWTANEQAIVDAAWRWNLDHCEPPLSREQVEHQVAGAMKKEGGQELVDAQPVFTGRPRALDEVIAVFREWLHLPDPGPVQATLATVATNRVADLDPLWLLLVGPSGGGKTETLGGITGLPDVYQAATLTEAALLSGTSRKEKAASAKGGLLREIGDFGVLMLKDFGSVLSMHRDARAAVLAALREIYDGAWTRHVGTDGGQTLSWSGKVGLVAGATPAIDQHHAVLAQLGERFVFYRLSVDDAAAQARRSLRHQSREREMRTRLREAVSGLFATLDLEVLPSIGADDEERLVALTTLVARARSSVIRDSYHREIELVPDAEAPGRLIGALARLLTGLRLIGADDQTAWRIVVKSGLDSMPAARLRALEHLIANGTSLDTTEIATAIALPTQTGRRILEDLAAHGLVDRISQGQGKADMWLIDPWATAQWRIATRNPAA